jgi:hypothetical protein
MDASTMLIAALVLGLARRRGPSSCRSSSSRFDRLRPDARYGEGFLSFDTSTGVS